jgi:redox-sensitive bicupin YhaK (pirin superfamily)
MEKVVNSVQSSQMPITRSVIHRSRGFAHGPIVRLMSPSDLGEELKPFVFLDLLDADMRALAGGMPVHPHSGIATIAVFTEGDVTFDDPQAGHGTLGYGGVEWVRAGRGMWHGKELSAGTSKTVQGFQLWIALPPDLENAEPEAPYIGAEAVPTIGPADLIVGAYGGATSPVRALGAINYFLVTLKPGERWTCEPSPGHLVAWVALARGALVAGERLSAGELVTFQKNDAPITFEGVAPVGATFVLGSAAPHLHQLHLGAYSVHTSEKALAAGERNIRELKRRLDAAGDRRTGSGATPVFRE